MSLAQAPEMIAAPGFRGHRWRRRDVLIGCSTIILARVLVPIIAGRNPNSFPAWSWIPLAFLLQAWLAGWPLAASRLRPVLPGPRRILVEFGYAILTLLVLLAAMYGVTLIAWLFAFGSRGDASPFEPAAGASGAFHPIALVLLGVLVAPLAEEIFFRGMLFNALKQRMHFIAAALISAAAFALMHPFGLTQRLGIAVAGFFLALLYQWRKTLVAPILLHSMVNGLGLAMLFYAIAAAADAPVLGVRVDAQGKGCIVTEVIPRSAAESAGLRTGDVITHAGEYSVRDMTDLTTVVRWKKVGDMLPVWYVRGGEPGYLEAKLQGRTTPPGTGSPTKPK